MASRLAAFAFVLTALWWADTAVAGDRVRSLGRSEFMMEADGSRFVVYKTTSTALTVRDDVRRRRYRIPIGATCRPGPLARGGFLMLHCSRADVPGERPISDLDVVNLRTGASTRVPDGSSGPVPGPPDTGDSERGYSEIGRYWLQGYAFFNGHSRRTYLNWRTGEGRSFGPEKDSGAYARRDLDDPDLPAVAPETPYSDFFAFDPPFSAGLIGRRSGAARLTLFKGSSPRSFGTPVARLGRCSASCGSLSIGAGLVTWKRGRTAYSYEIASGRRFSRRAPGPWPRQFASQAVRHTRTTVYTSVFEPGTRTWRLYAERWKQANGLNWFADRRWGVEPHATAGCHLATSSDESARANTTAGKARDAASRCRPSQGRPAGGRHPPEPVHG